jgi:tetratricopeptide (TPR) repeat protein
MQDAVRTLILACREAFDEGDYRQVLAYTELLTSLHPERASVWRARAEALVGLGRHADALGPYQQALELTPNDAQLRVRFARAMARCGLHERASLEFETAFATHPGSLAALHGVLTYRTLAPEDPALSVVHSVASGAMATRGSRAFACFLLGRIFILAGHDQEGFGYYETGNRLTRALLDQEAPMRGPSEFINWWAARSAKGNGRLPAAISDASPACCAVVIAGLPRSGKSLIEHLLAAHPALAAGEEIGGLHEAVEAQAGQPELRLQQLGSQPDSAIAQIYEQALATHQNKGAKRIIDTSPANLWDLGYLGHLHPEVPIILCRRSVLDQGAAIYFKKFRSGHAYSYNQSELGTVLGWAERAVDTWLQTLPNPLQVIDYEELVANPTRVRDELLRSLGLDSDQCVASNTQACESSVNHPPIHASHSSPGYGAVVADAVGFGARFSVELAPMMEAYRRTRG